MTVSAAGDERSQSVARQGTRVWVSATTTTGHSSQVHTASRTVDAIDGGPGVVTVVSVATLGAHHLWTKVVRVWDGVGDVMSSNVDWDWDWVWVVDTVVVVVGVDLFGFDQGAEAKRLRLARRIALAILRSWAVVTVLALVALEDAMEVGDCTGVIVMGVVNAVVVVCFLLSLSFLLLLLLLLLRRGF